MSESTTASSPTGQVPEQQRSGVPAANPHPIVFYDGTCGFCSWGVQWMLRHERRHTLHFAPLQGSTYQHLDHAHKPTDMSSMVVLDQGKLYTASDSTVRALRALGGFWSFAGRVLGLIPRPVRDWGYAIMARNRYRIAGRTEVCTLPTDEQRGRMLP